MKRYESFIVGEPTIPMKKTHAKDLVNAIKAMCFRYASAPGNVVDRFYFANNSNQKKMGQQTRFEMAKNNFPVKVSLYGKN